MTKTGARSLLAAIPLALVLALTACGAGDGGSNDDVASADGSTPNGSDGGETNEPLGEDEIHDKLLEYAQCLRDHGADVDDPAPGEGLQLQETEPGEFDNAMKACEDKAPPPPPSDDFADEREEMLAYAKCMRDNGVEKFKDPKPGEGISLDADTAEDPDFKAAEEKCNEEIMGGQPDTQEG